MGEDVKVDGCGDGGLEGVKGSSVVDVRDFPVFEVGVASLDSRLTVVDLVVQCFVLCGGYAVDWFSDRGDNAGALVSLVRHAVGGILSVEQAAPLECGQVVRGPWQWVGHP